MQLTDNDALKRLARAWGAKWDGRWRFEVRNGAFHQSDGGMAVVFSLMPAKILAFAKGVFSQTRHRF